MRRYLFCGLILTALLLAFCAQPDPEQLAVQAEEAISQGLYEEGIEKMRMVLQIEPANVKVRDKLSLLLFSMGRFDEAAQEYGELVKHRAQKAGFDPNWGPEVSLTIDDKEKAKKDKIDEALFYLGLSEMKLKRYDDTREHFRRALAINEGWKVADFMNKCIDGLRDGTLTESCFAHFEDAIDNHVLPETPLMIPYYEKVSEECPDFRDGQFNLGICLLNAKKFDDSLKTFQTLVKAHPEDCEAHRLIGFLRARDGKLREAIAHYKKAIECDPENGEALYQLGEVYFKWKNTRQATRYMKKYLELEPTGYYAKAARELLTEMGVKGYEQ